MLLIYFFISGAVSYELVAEDFKLQLIELQFQQLQESHKTPCVHSALSSYILECKEKGVDMVQSATRIRLAVQLSVCEFEEAGVKYPESCRSSALNNDYKACVQEFRGIPQLWTTYSGNYRKLRSICFEESLPFMKNHVIDLFYNITKIYSDLFNEATDSNKRAEEYSSAIEKKMEAFMVLLNSILQKVDRQQKDSEEAFEQFETSMRKGYDTVRLEGGTLSKNMFAEMGDVKSQLECVNILVTELDSRFSGLSSRLVQLDEMLTEGHKRATLKILGDLQSLDMTLLQHKSEASLLSELLTTGVDISSEINYKLQTAVNSAEMSVVAMDQRLHSLYSSAAIKMSNKSELIMNTVETQLQQVLESTDGFRDLVQNHFTNITKSIANIEHRILASSFPLVVNGVFGSIALLRNMVLFYVKMGTFIAGGLALAYVKLRGYLRAQTFSFSAMVPGIALAMILRLLLAAYWS